ncbi:hypothetical protein FQA39_LY11735 [Lamprigera yunnana]|nr:hypothetical protein FQA39_LY11735 [Lamprigera yunnana]
MNTILRGFLVTTVIYCVVHGYPLNDKEKECVDQHKLNKTNIEAWNVQPLIPVENKEMGKFFACYWKKLGYQKENGEIDYIKLSEAVHDDLKGRFYSDCLHIVAFVVDNCRKSVEENDDLKVLKLWNCLNVYTENLF